MLQINMAIKIMQDLTLEITILLIYLQGPLYGNANYPILMFISF